MGRRKKVRIPVLFTPNGSMQKATCVVEATVSAIH